MPLTNDQLIGVLTKYLRTDYPDMTEVEAAAEIRESLAEDTDAYRVLMGIAEDIWQLGYTAGSSARPISDKAVDGLG